MTFFAMVPDFDGVEQPAFFMTRKLAPKGAVKISSETHLQLLEAQAAGKIIKRGRGGKPQIADRAIDFAFERAQLVKAIRREAARRIDLVSPIWRQLNDWREPSEAGAARFAQIDAIRAASGAIEDTLNETPDALLGEFPVRANPLWPEID